MWCFVIVGVMTAIYGVIMIRDGLAGRMVSDGHYKHPKMVTGQTAVIKGVGAIVLGLVEIGFGLYGEYGR